MGNTIRRKQLSVPRGGRASTRCASDALLLRDGHHARHERSEAGHRLGLRGRLSDAAGNYFDGSRTYNITLPGPIPAKNFWAFTVYDNQTRSLLPTDQKTPGVDSTAPGVQKNSDGRVTIWFGPQAPAGHEKNWVQTMPGRGYNVILRLYGPLEPWFNKSWRPGDLELQR